MSSLFITNQSWHAPLKRLMTVVCFSSVLALVGCGQKGDLYLPDGDASAEGQQMIESGSSPQDDAFDRVDDEPMTDLPTASDDPNDY